MLLWVNVDGNEECREHVKDKYGFMICQGMYVVSSLDCRKGWVSNVIDESGTGIGKIQVTVVYDSTTSIDKFTSYVTEFEPASNWCKALVDG